jgi:hypothetical protein
MRPRCPGRRPSRRAFGAHLRVTGVRGVEALKTWMPATGAGMTLEAVDLLDRELGPKTPGPNGKLGVSTFELDPDLVSGLRDFERAWWCRTVRNAGQCPKTVDAQDRGNLDHHAPDPFGIDVIDDNTAEFTVLRRHASDRLHRPVAVVTPPASHAGGRAWAR